MNRLSDLQWEDGYDCIKDLPISKLYEFQSAFVAGTDVKVTKEIGEMYNSLLINPDPHGPWIRVTGWTLPKEYDEALEEIVARMELVTEDTSDSILQGIGADLGEMFKIISTGYHATEAPERGPSLPMFTNRTNGMTISYHLTNGTALPGGMELINIPVDLNVSDAISGKDTTKSKLWDTLEPLYLQAYQDQLSYVTDNQKYMIPPLNTVKLKIESDNLYGPAVLIKMLLNPPGHRMKSDVVKQMHTPS